MIPIPHLSLSGNDLLLLSIQHGLNHDYDIAVVIASTAATTVAKNNDGTPNSNLLILEEKWYHQIKHGK